ncbi:MAG: HesA/MoeB/ThiF family protein [Betaproteobacteria bacterium]|nr:HesA/MoeB/ThiF family protein [Betaproteobacteria bacterium]
MDKDQRLRYSRHILLPNIGLEGQERLAHAHALIVGAGGLGSPVALYLAASGVGHLTVCDGDTVEISNLQRQILHGEDALGRNKADSAKASLGRLNASVEVTALPRAVGKEELRRLCAQADVVIDCSDNFATRHAVNDACVTARRPLVSGAAIRFDGQVAVFDLRAAESPCYHCLFPDTGLADDVRCADNGIFSPLVGIIGSIQAAEAVALLAGIMPGLAGHLLLVDALTMTFRRIALAQDSGCPVCRRARSAPPA